MDSIFKSFIRQDLQDEQDLSRFHQETGNKKNILKIL